VHALCYPNYLKFEPSRFCSTLSFIDCLFRHLHFDYESWKNEFSELPKGKISKILSELDGINIIPFNLIVRSISCHLPPQEIELLKNLYEHASESYHDRICFIDTLENLFSNNTTNKTSIGYYREDFTHLTDDTLSELKFNANKSYTQNYRSPDPNFFKIVDNPYKYKKSLANHSLLDQASDYINARNCYYEFLLELAHRIPLFNAAPFANFIYLDILKFKEKFIATKTSYSACIEQNDDIHDLSPITSIATIIMEALKFDILNTLFTPLFSCALLDYMLSVQNHYKFYLPLADDFVAVIKFIHPVHLDYCNENVHEKCNNLIALNISLETENCSERDTIINGLQTD